MSYFITGNNNATLVASMSIGKTPSYNEYMGIAALTGLLGVNNFLALSKMVGGSLHNSFNPGDVVAFNVTTGATATTLTASVYLFGILV